MGEVDYQMALLLQHKFEQEYKMKKLQKTDTESDYRLALALQEEGDSSKNHYTPSLTNSDKELALHLQEDFKREAAIEEPTNNLVYKKSKNANNSKSLVDPSWEVIDPTPDVHVLFMAFNDKFFWATLGSVTVSWSKKMTTCAGVCSYQGRGGMCSITLSEPLLKLRPRKDLVETLLHEMIHAYLFVTNNNRDRDGHGPEFHKHMYRINAEAGTNITVYHDFHDEVKLYQQHWWRCDGPCQQRKPYFGMVRRAMNRAPGPNDNWWAEHQRNCGGTFIKVKEPEKPKKPVKEATKKVGGKAVKEPTPTKPGNDIRNYIPTQNKNASMSNTTQKKGDNSIGVNKENKITKPINTKSASNVHGISNHNSNSTITNVIPSKISNIHGFTNLSTPSNSNSSGKNQSGNKNSGFGVKGATTNCGSNTVVVNKKSSTTVKQKDSNNDSVFTNAVNSTFTGKAHKLFTNSDTITPESDYSAVRNHWLKKFENKKNDIKKSTETSPKNGIKRTNSTPIFSQKIPRLSLNEPSTSKEDTIRKSECPVCKLEFPLRELNAHLDDCLSSQNENTKECIICGKEINVSDYELHVSKCCEESFKDSDDVFEDESDKKCSKCDKQIKKAYFDSHYEVCGDDIMDLTKDTSLNSPDKENKNCPVCKLSLTKSEFDPHVEKCLMDMFDTLEEKYDIKTDKKTPCLACGKEILKSELDAHLEDCMNMSNVFDTTNVPIEEEEEDTKNTSGFNCPICLQLVLEEDMQNHLDKCLNEVHDSKEVERNKSIVFDSFSDD